jgi:tetratricopeptide (TPR) repeat protein
MASVLIDLAGAHQTLGQYRRAAATYRRALGYLKTPQKVAETLIALARANAALGAEMQALDAYHDALQYEHPPAVRRALLMEQASVFSSLKQYAAAIESLQKAQRIEGPSSMEQAALWRSLGQTYAAMGRHDEARAQFEQALTAVEDEQTGLTLIAIAEGHRAQGQTGAALDAYSRAVPHLDRAMYPAERAAAFRAMGEIYLKDVRAVEAISALESALDIERALPRQDGGRIVTILQEIAEGHELRGELEKATIRHHEALVYQDSRHAPERYSQTLRTLGRLYASLFRYDEAVKALEDALGTEYAQATPDTQAVDETTKMLADVYRAQGKLGQAADLYRRVSVVNTAPTVRESASQALDGTLGEISRHEETLQTARQSWALLNRTANPDLKSLVFVLALQAQANAALERWEESESSLEQMMDLLMVRRTEVSTSSRDPALRALALMLEGYTLEKARSYERALDAYRMALKLAEESKLSPALLWTLRQKIGKR